MSYKNYRKKILSIDQKINSYLHLTKKEYYILLKFCIDHNMKYNNYENCFYRIDYDINEYNKILRSVNDLSKLIPNIYDCKILDIQKKEYKTIIYIQRRDNNLKKDIDIFITKYPNIWNELYSSS